MSTPPLFTRGEAPPKPGTPEWRQLVVQHAKQERAFGFEVVGYLLQTSALTWLGVVAIGLPLPEAIVVAAIVGVFGMTIVRWVEYLFHRWHTVPLAMQEELIAKLWRLVARRMDVQLHSIRASRREGADGVFLAYFVSIINHDEPTIAQHVGMYFIEPDGRATTGIYLDRPTSFRDREAFLSTGNMYLEDDLRSKCAVAFGNGDRRDGWLLGFFPDLPWSAVEDTSGRANLSFVDSDGRRHGTERGLGVTIDFLPNLPGLAAQPVVGPRE